MILSDKQILLAIEMDRIKIEPFRRECLGSNSYDVHLGVTLGVYVKEEPSWARPAQHSKVMPVLDAKKEPKLDLFEIPDDGWVLEPGVLYLGATEEYTETHGFVPWIDGKSSVGRLGIRVHATAGRGDAGFMNHWTLEIDCVQPVRIYKGMPIGQITYFMTGPIDVPYNRKAYAKYNARTPSPVPSAMHMNFDPETGKWK
jgi:dCTP deaminase